MTEPQWTLVFIFAAIAIALILMALIDDAIQHRGPLWRWYERRIKRPMARRATWREIKKNRGKLY